MRMTPRALAVLALLLVTAPGEAAVRDVAGLPGVAVPAGLDAQGLPLGLQLIGRPWEEGDLLNCAYALEGAAGFVEKPGKWW